MKRFRIAVPLMSVGLSLFAALGTARAQETTNFDLLPVNATCLPNAKGRVIVFHKEEQLGVDTLRLRVNGLPPNTDFAVFLTSADGFSKPPFGVTEYIGDFTTNAVGIGSLQVDAIIQEAFVTNPVPGTPPTRSRTDLDHLVFWFANPDQVPGCFRFNPTPFDGDGVAGPAAMSSSGLTGLELE
jgi:hypothetical protein